MHPRIPWRDPGSPLEHLQRTFAPASAGERLAHRQQEVHVAIGLRAQLLGDGPRLFHTIELQQAAREPGQRRRIPGPQASRLREALQCLAVQAPQQEDLTHD